MDLSNDKLIFFIGSYTEMLTPNFGGSGKGVSTVSLNLNSGVIEFLNAYMVRNPAYLTANNGYLYAVTEVEDINAPKVSSFKILDDFSLKFVNEQPLDGSLPCHINTVNNNLLVACYGSGNLVFFPLGAKGTILGCSHNFVHKGKSINKDRQEAPHAHQAVVHPDGERVFVTDLGIDKIKVYRLKEGILEGLPEKDISIPKGNGPRHMVFNTEGNLCYVMNELTGKIAILKYKEDKFYFEKLYDALPASFTGVPSGSAIRIHPNGAYLYAANRTVDVITIFEIKNEELHMLAYQLTNGKTLREFNITPDGNWLIACLQDSNEVINYAITASGLLEEKSRTNSIVSPVCVCFL
ncbi:lactonase family protein [Algibacter agarivorans]|uniref:Lactonase family protein n=1 Tax=Algibacter agarivorans TaxID=1109741 RepID=A0ABP9GLX3_9FLAO